MGCTKITAGSGYDYLTRQVAAQDSTEKGHTSLASYYTEKGETPGVWVGSGLADLGGLAVGDQVTAEQMQSLFGAGYHPLARQRMDALGAGHTEREYLQAARLGAPFKVYSPDVSPFRLEVARRLTAYNTAIGQPADAAVPAGERARIRTEVGREFFRTEYGRDPADARELAGLIAKASRPRTTAVAGFDLTFSPVKSVSSLWALADPPTAAVIEQAHNAAVADALAFLETHALFTRTGANGVRQVNVRGLVAAAFTHRDSRAGDPDLHTHVAVANKAQTADGRWLAIDGRLIFKATVAASETYNTALEAHLVQALGVRFVERATEAGKRPVREIDGVSPELNRRWSQRRASIEQRRQELAVAFQHHHGRPPTPIETIALAQQATLETRQAKHEPRSLAEQRAVWRWQAEQVLGGPGGVRTMLRSALSPAQRRPRLPDEAWFERTASQLIGTLEASRATWQTWHVRAEALRRVRARGLPPQATGPVVARLVQTALAGHSVALAAPDDGIVEPAALRRRDGASVYTVAGANLYTSTRVIAAEQRLVDSAGRRDGMVADARVVEVALLESLANGLALNAGQAELVRGMATSGARLQVAIAPAGSGKTTAMRALSRAWSEAGGTVIGLAPSAAAAAALREQIDTHTDTLAKLTWSLDHHDLPAWADQIGPTTLVVIDEAGMADTLTLDAAVRHVLDRGGSVRLIGDDQQLAAIGAGGVLRDIATRHGALRLTELVRFADPAEAGASLALREGRPESLGFYLDRGRVHVGDLATITHDVFHAWQADTAAGRDSIMLAPTRELVAELNERARTHRLAGTTPTREVLLADGLSASVGDTIITRTNQRRLRTGATDFVKNGDRWAIQAIDHGALHVRHTRTHRTTVLPADYVAASVELGYASTVHTAQGVSVDTMHGIATGGEGRQQLYTMLTRGRHANHVYLKVVGDGDPHTLIRPDTIHPPTATDVLEGILARDTASASASSQQHHLQDPRTRLGHAASRYHDALLVAAEQVTGELALRALERQADQIVPGLPWSQAWPVLRSRLLLVAADGRDPVTELARAAAKNPLRDAHDPAAVLDWRLDDTTGQGTSRGPLPWLPAIPRGLAEHPDWGSYLTGRRDLVTQLADDVHATALASRTAPWLAHHHGPVTGQTIADITVWRAAHGIADTDLRPTGERQWQPAAAHWQQHLQARLAGDRSPAVDEWAPLLHQLAAGTRTDPFTATLAERLTALSSAGIPAGRLLRAAADHGALPDNHPAAALWWRIARHLTPNVTESLTDAHPLTAAWSADLPDLVGTERAHDWQNSPWWPSLVTAIDRATQHGWRPADLLTDPGLRAPSGGLVDECQALVWRISLLTDPHPTLNDDPPDPANDTPPDDLWDGYHPPAVPAEPARPALAVDVDADDSGWVDDLTLEALHREALGVPEPSDVQIQQLLARADAWRACPATPERLATVNELAAAFYQDHYPGSWAQPYLHDRFGVDLAGDPTLRPGYAPAGWTSLVTHLRRHGVTDPEMIAAGLATTAATGRLIDRFRDRVVFPLRHDGVVLGFVGRRHPNLEDGPQAGPKYLNTGETPLFRKGDQLFIAGTDLTATPVITEGPMDAIAVTLASNGYVGVAALGTSLTDQQAAQLQAAGHRSPIVATDNDLAGQVAAERDYWILTPYHLHPRYAHLPAGADPADLHANGHSNQLVAALDTATPLANLLADERFAHLPPAEAALSALQVVAAQPPEHWETGLHHIAAQVGAPTSVLRKALKDTIQHWNRDPRAAAQRPLRDVADVKQRLALHETVRSPETVASTTTRRPIDPAPSTRPPSRGVDR